MPTNRKIRADCVHCRRLRTLRGRGLCSSCYDDRAVRSCYPPATPVTKADSETQEELDRIVAEQMEKLPAWWYDRDPEEETFDADGVPLTRNGTRKRGRPCRVVSNPPTASWREELMLRIAAVRRGTKGIL